MGRALHARQRELLAPMDRTSRMGARTKRNRSWSLAMLAVVGWLALFVTPVAAQTRIGYIDSARIWLEFKTAQEAQQRFERQVQGWRDEAAEKEKVVTNLRKQVQDQSPVLS